MDIFAATERMMRMTDADWQRHANPWSGWTRVAILPALAAVIWFRAALGWMIVIPLGLLILWVWVNPRAFPPPADYGAWMTRGVLGERLWLDRARRPVPAHHRRAAWVTSGIAFTGLPFLIWGLAVLDPFATLLGMALTMGGKLWFLDRMVWLHADLTGTTPGTPLLDPTLPDPEGPAP